MGSPRSRCRLGVAATSRHSHRPGSSANRDHSSDLPLACHSATAHQQLRARPRDRLSVTATCLRDAADHVLRIGDAARLPRRQAACTPSTNLTSFYHMIFNLYAIGDVSSVMGFAPRAVRPAYTRVVRVFCGHILNRSDNLRLPSVPSASSPDRIEHLGLFEGCHCAKVQLLRSM